MKKILFTLLLLSSLCVPAFAASWEEARYLPVQHNGRIKPFEAFSRQTLKHVAGAERWQKKPAAEFFWETLDPDPGQIKSVRFIRIDYTELKTKLGLATDDKYFSLDDLSGQKDAIESLVREAKVSRDRDERPSKLAQKAEQLYSKVRAVEGAASGDSWTRVPAGHASKEKIYLEVLYHRLRPFEWAAGLYFLAFLLLSFIRKENLRAMAIFALIAAFVFHSFGLASRVFILSRPPVSNMYESMIFMNWALMLFAFIFTAVKKNAVPLVAGAALSGLIMLYADLLPIDASLDVVVAVLRSNYWLSIHVLTVVSSYGAFGLAMALGHRHLYLHVNKRPTKKAEQESAELIFKIIQLGTLLIGTGTFLGGVWANESWGRFWGWDPKETWALITFLGYLIVVHLKYAKKITDFYIAVSSVAGFLLVLMTWYGVNFVLGRGLHSYGAGSGGMEWVIYYLAGEAAFLGWVFLRRGTKRSSG